MARAARTAKLKAEAPLVGISFSAIAQALLSGSGVLPMMATLIVIGICCVAAISAIWRWAQVSNLTKVLSTIGLLIIATISSAYVYKRDRPVLAVSIGGLLVGQYRDADFAIFTSVIMKNEGLQGAYVDLWKIALIVDETRYEGRQDFGSRTLPQGAAELPFIESEEFPKGKTVRGWLAFVFPGVASERMNQLFSCTEAANNNVTIELRVVDSLEHAEWTTATKLSELAHSLCGPLNRVPSAGLLNGRESS